MEIYDGFNLLNRLCLKRFWIMEFSNHAYSIPEAYVEQKKKKGNDCVNYFGLETLHYYLQDTEEINIRNFKQKDQTK